MGDMQSLILRDGSEKGQMGMTGPHYAPLEEKGCTLEPIFEPLPLMKTV